MKILMQTTYYYPHISGLTLYFQHLAEELVNRGHTVTMIAAQHQKTLPRQEKINGVKVIRTPAYLRFNKGLSLPQIIFDAWSHLRNSDIVHLNLPAVEAFDVAVAVKILRKPLVSTYVCDITLPNFPFSKTLDKLIDLNHYLTLKLSDQIATYTQDFAENSRVLRKFRNVTEIYPPVYQGKSDASRITNSKLQTLSKQAPNSDSPLIGMATRWSADKGIEYLLQTIPDLTDKFPNLKITFAGNTRPVGEEKYRQKLQPLLERYHDRVVILEQLNPDEMSHFYDAIDLLVVSSINSTEAFGLVQVEAMLQATPVVATNLPGVRVPIQKTGMGEIAKIADSKDLAAKIIQVLENKQDYIKPPQEIRKIFDPEKSIQQYLELYEKALHS